MKITTEDLQKLLDDVTPGEWAAALEHGCHGVIAAILPDVANFVAVVGNNAGTPEREPMRFANAEIMALAPAITREVIALRAAAEKLADALRSIQLLSDCHSSRVVAKSAIAAYEAQQ